LGGGAVNAGPNHSAPASRAGKGQSFLPQWAESGFARITGVQVGYYGVNTSMPCLNHIHSTLSQLVPGVVREKVAHISRALFCPCLACKGVPKVHESNGTFVALAEDGDVLYARCSDSSCSCDDKDMESDWMEVVKNSGKRPWVKLTAEKLGEFEGRTRQSRERPVTSIQKLHLSTKRAKH
jgi:hypothetical protein